jgi:hypothetical protein
MTSSSSVTLTGHSCATYEFEAFPLSSKLPPLPVVYLVFEQELKSSGTPLRFAVHVGQSPNAASCIDDHHRWRYQAYRATHVALHVDYDDLSRAQKVSDLVRALRPAFNG